LYWHAVNPGQSFQEYDKDAKKWVFKKGLLQELCKQHGQPPQLLQGVFGEELTLESLGRLERTFTPEHLGKAATANRLNQVMWTVINHTNQNQAKYKKGGEWVLPETVVDEAVKSQRLHVGYAKDAWGEPFRLVKRGKRNDKGFGNGQFAHYDLVSAGADGKMGTMDDVTSMDAMVLNFGGTGLWWMDQTHLARNGDPRRSLRRDALANQGLPGNPMLLERADARFAFGGALAGRGGGGPLPAPRAAMPMEEKKSEAKMVADRPGQSGAPAGGGGEAPITKVREYFPETMLWQPSLITDDKGVADLAVNFADSITTWRLTASANARNGALGGATVPLKVFQDFFVDIDLPVSLTQSDEVAFPVAIYNYLKEPQKLKIELQEEPWFQLLDKEGLTRTLDVKPGDVTSVKFRIKADKIGFQPLTVKAYGSKKSDAVKRVVEVVPNGQKIEKVVSDRLSGAEMASRERERPEKAHKIKHVIDIPADAIPDASKLIVRIYPGVMAQVLEGVEGMIRLPGG